MTSVGAYEAKTHLPQLLQRVEAGETIIITKHGREVAKLSPVDRPLTDVRKVVEEMLEARKGVILGADLTIRELIEEGRR